MKLGKLNGNFKSKTRARYSSGKSFIFPNFGNLIYYDGLKPNYFYFGSLLSDYERNEPNPRYRSMANQIGQQAYSMLSQIPGLGTQQAEKDGTDFSTQYNSIVKILELAIQTERENEVKFIKDKIAMLEKSFNPEYLTKHKQDLIAIKNLLSTLGSGDGIDYNKLITLINIIQQGLENTKSIFQFEAEHLEKLEIARKKNAEALEKQIRGLAVKENKLKEEADEMVKHALEKRNNLRVKTYLDKHNIVNLRSFKKYMKNMETSETKVADWMMRQISRQLEKNYDKFASKIKINGDPRSNGEIIREYLVTALLSKREELLPKILKTLTDNSIDLRGLERDLLKNFDQDLKIEITGAPQNFGVSKKKLALFKDRITQNNADTRSAGELYNTLEEIMKNLLKKSQADLSPEEQDLVNNLGPFYQQQIQPIQQLMSKIEKLNNQIITNQSEIKFSREDNKKDGKLILTISTKGKGNIKSSTFNLGEDFEQLGLNIYQSSRGSLPASLSSVITTMKSAASKKIRDEIVNLLINQTNSTAKKELEDNLSQIIQKIQVSVKGSDLEEIVQGMDHTFTKKLYTGGTFVKNDFMEIVVGMPDLEDTKELMVKSLVGQLDTMTMNPMTSTTFNTFSDIVTEFQQKYTNAIEADMKEVRSKKKYTDYNFMAEQFLKTQEEKTIALQKVQEAYEKLKEGYERKFKDNKKREKALEQLNSIRNKFLQSIQDTIYESSTMKTFRTYQNDIGFIGGELGADVASQVNSFQQLFEAAGVIVPDNLWNWLTSAIINCSSVSVIGEKNKDFIENYLGSLAIFSMFNEGGAELQLLRQQLAEEQLVTTNNVMHLYKMNGIYYPGSFILKQVLQNLIPFMNVIEQTDAQLRNKNVMIYNPASYSMLPNGKKSKKQGDTHPWQTVGQEISHGTKIKVLFLAGLLDVVKELHSKIESIELPA